MAALDGTLAVSLVVLLLLAAGAVARARWALRKYQRTAAEDASQAAGDVAQRRAA